MLAGLVGLGVGELAGLHPAVALGFGAGVAGAGMIPDIDEPGSAVAHLAEPLTGVVAWFTKRIAGGHRQASHSLLAVGIVAAGCYGLQHLDIARGVPAAVIPLGFAYALAIRGILPFGARPGHLMALVVGGAAAYGVVHYLGASWVWMAIGLGWWMHLVGDMLTSGGVPLFWPDKRHVSWPVLGHTNSTRESIFAVVLSAALVALAWQPVAHLIRGSGHFYV
ncbi:MAG: metal-dependent hydrolase [Acidimicrobiales bacterium]